MTSQSLTRDHARHRASLIKDVHYRVHLDVTGPETFTSTTTVTFSSSAGEISIDLNVMDGSWEATLNDEALRDLSFPVTEGEQTLVVKATIPYSRTGEGLHRFVDPADDKVYLYSQFEPADAHRVFACFDQPDIKATYELSMTTPESFTVVMNEPTTSTPSAEGTTHTCTIDYPLSTYLVAFIAGEYAHVHDTFENIELGLYARTSIMEHLDADRLFTETKQGFAYYHENFGRPYPFTKYDQIFCPEFNIGAMEHVGAVTIRDEYVFTSEASPYMYERRNETILHEMAHMWFGNLVTMQWWDDLWLNESFATWSAAITQAEATEHDTAWVTFANVEKAWAYSQDQLPSTHPISTDAPDVETAEQNFDGITYAKGASVLKQLQAYVGRDAFFAGVRAHFDNHAYGNATFDDLLGALEKASGRDLSEWSQQWLKTTGISTLYPEITDRFVVVQESDVQRTHRVGVGLYALIDDTVRRTHHVEIDITGERTEIPEFAGVEHDLALVNDGDLTYCLMGIAPQQQDFVVKHLGDIADPMARTLAWSAAWQATRAGEMPARDFVDLVARHLDAEDQTAVLERVAGQAAMAARYYVAENHRDQAFATLAEAFQGREPATIFDRALARLPQTEDSAAYLHSLLETSDNQEVRWLAITALIARGDLGLDALEQEGDRSSAGELARLRARAVVDKQWAFDEVMGGQRTNLEARHLMEGFNFTDGGDFTAAYFDQAQCVWQEQSSEMAQRTLTGLYPVRDLSDTAFARADELLAGELPQGLRRILSEERDKVERARRNRLVDEERDMKELS
ncbi:aminopeptidase N [Corynebacterium pilosum]|uniref:Aminopeptidase N n=1 Tax=Corynebacterium pilosum TaxID=35756 RepID=A0A376CKF8_9CORY|nr:aminopeptidase N [Corynebacterium pilosum]STC68677.1 aminopeptidase [Corynebacterium pilosum]